MNNHQTILEVENLCIEREETSLLRNVSWKVQKRENWVILGANGSGKTSLLSAVTGYLNPTSGKIKLLNHLYGESDWRELRKKVGLVSSSIRQLIQEQEPALDLVVSGKQALLNLWHPATTGDQKRGLHYLRVVGCAHLRDRPWIYLSQGERQRILIARALMAMPKVLILDEPCAGLDPVAREHFLQFVNDLARRKSSPTLIFVTHHIEEIMPAFSHLLVLQQGTVASQGLIQHCLNSRSISRAFNTKVSIVNAGDRFLMKVMTRRKRMF